MPRKIDKSAFSSYLRETGIAEGTCRKYLKAIEQCEFFAQEHRLNPCVLFTDDRTTAEKTVRALRDCEAFRVFNTQRRPTPSSALNKFVDFLYQEERDAENTAESENAKVSENAPVASSSVVGDCFTFFDYLRRVLNLNLGGCREYTTTIFKWEEFARNRGLKFCKLYGRDRNEAEEAIRQITSHADFQTFNVGQTSRLPRPSDALESFRDHLKRLASSNRDSQDAPGEKVQLAYSQYLRETLGIRLKSLNAYVGVCYCEALARDRYHLDSWELFTDDRPTIQRTIELLKNNADFQAYDEKWRRRPSDALQTFCQFLNQLPDAEEQDAEEPDSENTDSAEIKRVVAVLKDKFSKGFRLESSIELTKFRRKYQELYGKETTASDEELTRVVRECCVVHESKDIAYLPELLLDADRQKEVFDYLQNIFSRGASAIYYEALYQNFQRIFKSSFIRDAEMLKNYLKATRSKLGKGPFYFKRSFVVRSQNADPDSSKELIEFARKHDRPVKNTELFDAARHLTKKKIQDLIDRDFIRNSNNEYFLREKVVDVLTDEDCEKIATLIRQSIKENGHVSDEEIHEVCQTKFNHIFEKLPDLSSRGLRELLILAGLDEEFSFHGKIISPPGTQKKRNDVFAQFAQTHEEFTLEELNNLSKELGTPVDFEAVYQNSLRISREKFMSKERAKFNVKETDAVLDRICGQASYVSIQEANNLASPCLPEAGFTWNSFLLEHYVAQYSESFRLVHVAFNGSQSAGAIVRRSAEIRDFYALVEDLLTTHSVKLEKEAILQFLIDKKYLTRKRWNKRMESIIANVAMKRQNKKGRA